MPKTITEYSIDELSHAETKNEVFIASNPNTRLQIVVKDNRTIIRLPFGNKFDIVGGEIIIYDIKE